ncbi:MAG: hypothetical protein P8104_00540 [Gammaproteobacteria bacterium]
MFSALAKITEIAGVEGLAITALLIIFLLIIRKNILAKLTTPLTFILICLFIILAFFIFGRPLISQYISTHSPSPIDKGFNIKKDPLSPSSPPPTPKPEPKPVCPEQNCFFVEQETACRSDAFIKQYISKRGMRLINKKTSHTPIVSLNCDKEIVNLDGSLPEELGERIVKVNIGISIDMNGESLFYDQNFYSNKNVYLGTEKEAIAATLRNFSSVLQTKLKLQTLIKRG